MRFLKPIFRETKKSPRALRREKMFKKILALLSGGLIVLSLGTAQAEARVILEITPGWVGTSPPNITGESEGVVYADFIVRAAGSAGQEFSVHVTNVAGVIQKVQTEAESLGNDEYRIKFCINNIPEAVVIFDDNFTTWKFKVTPDGAKLKSRIDLSPH